MFDELLPASLSTGARELGVEPLELVRLLVESDTVTTHLTVTPDHLARLAQLGGIESGWWDGVELPPDTVPARARVRGALGLLLQRGDGGKAVRMDNLWRGLAGEDQELLDEAMNILADEEVIRIVNAPAGVQVLLDAPNASKISALIAGTSSTPGLDELYQG